MPLINSTIVLVALVITLAKLIGSLSGMRLSWPNETIGTLINIVVWVSIVISSLHLALKLL